MGTRPLSLGLLSLLLGLLLLLSGLLLLSDALPWVLRHLGASWSESDILWHLVEEILPWMVPLWVVGKVEHAESDG